MDNGLTDSPGEGGSVWEGANALGQLIGQDQRKHACKSVKKLVGRDVVAELQIMWSMCGRSEWGMNACIASIRQ